MDWHKWLIGWGIIRIRSTMQQSHRPIQFPVRLYDQSRYTLLCFCPALGAKGLNPLAPSTDKRTKIRRNSAPEIVGAAIALKKICRQESPATFVADSRNKPELATFL